ncbi:hypothetical protein LIER_43459 [Lithospermum erythrorhizon]|uniref:Uncharacterized protein n=1 Tax=Lithospermum erythrorhizon TaxID=34254 RepID=A0AAV3Q7W5_LITER
MLRFKSIMLNLVANLGPKFCQPLMTTFSVVRTSIDSLEPRALSQKDFEKVLATSTKTMVAAIEYSRLRSESSSWSLPNDGCQVEATINELSKLVVSQIMNCQSDDRDRDT